MLTRNVPVRNLCAFLFVLFVTCGGCADGPYFLPSDASVPDAPLKPCSVVWEDAAGQIERVGDGFWRVEFRALSDLALVRICAVGDNETEEVVSLSLHPNPDQIIILGKSLVGTGMVCLTPDQGAFEDISLEDGGVYRANVIGAVSPSQIFVEVVSTDPLCDIERLGQRGL